MWQELLKIPHPSLADILISSEVFMVLYPLRMIMHVLESDLEKEKRRLRENHRKRHSSRARFCRQEDCLKISPGSSPRYPQQAIQQISVTDQESLPTQEQPRGRYLSGASL